MFSSIRRVKSQNSAVYRWLHLFSRTETSCGFISLRVTAAYFFLFLLLFFFGRSTQAVFAASRRTGSEDTTSSMQCNQDVTRRGAFLSVCSWSYSRRSPQLSCSCRYDRTPELSRPDSGGLLVKGAKVGSTKEVGGKSLYQPITMLVSSKSSNKIWAAPMNDLWSMRP